MKLTDGSSTSCMPELIELKPDKLLLDPKFTGYKLSLNTVPVQTLELKKKINKVGPTESQYSLQHAAAFANQNLLFATPWDQHTVYFVDIDWVIWQVSSNPLDGRVLNPVKVWQIPGEGKDTSGRFNVGVLFPSPSLVVVSNGCGNVFLLEVEQCTWREIYKSSTEPSKPLMCLDTVHYKTGSNFDAVDLLLLYIADKMELMKEFNLEYLEPLVKGDNAFLTVVEWQVLMKDTSNNWKVSSKRLLAGRNGVHYAAIAPGGNSLYVASDSAYYFIHDSENPVSLPTSMDVEEKKPEYLWTQVEDKVKVWISLAASSTKEDIEVVINSESLNVSYKNEVILTGAFYKTAKPDDSSWDLDTGKLEIILQKEENERWSDLIPGNKAGEEIVDDETIQLIHSRLAHLCTDKWDVPGDNVVLNDNFEDQLEECDRLSDEMALLMLFTKGNHKINHQVSLTGHPVLFTVRPDPKKTPAVCMRFHHDGLVWQPEEAGDAGSCRVCHIATYSALGYVQAGKPQRKFTVSSPDFSYVALCDTIKHVYLYRSPEELQNNELRNRKTGQLVKHVATQQILATDPPVEIVGAYASPERLFILTSNHLHGFRVREPAEL